MKLPSTEQTTPNVRPKKLDLDQRAISILRENEWGDYTLPTKGLYPYQWNWDSMFVALGFSEIDLDRAWTEVESLFQGQWKNGMAAHIVFRRDSPSYFPGPKIWGGTHEVPTSGCSQPPVAATIVRDLYEKDPVQGKKRLLDLFPRLMRWHRWFHTMRVISGGAAIAVTHPWESGRDNSPDWDEALDDVDPSGVTPYTRKDLGHVDAAMRPTNAQYDRYIKLVEYGRNCGWDHAQITREGPFAVADPGITFILMRADRDLQALARYLEKESAVHEIDTWLYRDKIAADYLWNDDIDAYAARNMRNGQHSDGVSSVSFLSYYAGITKPKRDAKLQRTLNRILSIAPYSLPSFDPEHPKFDSKRYWRGPTWAIINYLVARGLSEYGFEEKANRIRLDTRRVIQKSGFYEYFDPITGEGSGGNNFTWTAAIWLAWASPMTDG
ncbi:trehalase family glycosidase [Pelagicoccus sp. SDUM812003]|uniref:MGH1-like glycoside hydrolase domain-containing protein n=1 Tax=Pelagicoccus sp. SDUM812003 TaxID=3041267 RepID=UPI00280EF0A7|nr:trehalase family glycosidase [Pelagicoccus sp. SDUM812003]MDQ8202358.1 trehalase family glycosidase [Pelagicoccus sp. SDUM812003]